MIHKAVLIEIRNKSAGSGIFHNSFNFRDILDNHKKKKKNVGVCESPERGNGVKRKPALDLHNSWCNLITHLQFHM